MNYLLDTNTVIDYITDLLPKSADIVFSNKQAISFITRIELLAWPQLSVSDEMIYKKFIAASIIYGSEEAIISQTIFIRKQYKLKLPDAFIAATAIVKIWCCLVAI